MQESEAFAVQALPVLGKSSAPAEPREGPLHDPSLGQDDEAFGLIGAFDDLDIHLRHDFPDGFAKQRALIAAVGVELQQRRELAKQCRHHKFAAIAILNVGGVNDGVDQQALRIDKNMPLLALDFLASVVPRPIMDPPFSALLTLWESMTAAVGLASRPTASRHFT